VIRHGRVLPKVSEIPQFDALFNALHNPSKVASGELRIPVGFEDDYAKLRELTDWEQSFRLDFDPEMATISDYFYRGWKVPEAMAKAMKTRGGRLPLASYTGKGWRPRSKQFVPSTVRRAASRILGPPARGAVGVRPSFKKPRIGATYQEMRDLGFEPISWNPYEQWRISRLQGVRYRQQMQLIDDFKRMDLARPSGSDLDIDGWRTPEIGPAFQGKVLATVNEAGKPVPFYTHRYVVQPDMAKHLEALYGIPPDWGTVTVRGREMDLRKAVDAAVFIPKRAKLFGSIFQQADFARRNTAGGWAAAIAELRAGKPLGAVEKLWSMPFSVRTMAVANTRANARARIKRELNSITPIMANRPGVHLRGIMEAGLSTIDVTLLPRNLDEIARVEADKLGLLGNQSIRRGLSSLESAMRRGLFEGWYPAAQVTDIKNNIAPMMVRMYGHLSDEALNGMIAKATNKRYSTIPVSQSVVQNRSMREFLSRMLFSFGESEGLFRQLTGAMHGPDKEFWRYHWLGMYAGLFVTANAIHFASTGEALPLGRYTPISRDSWGPLPIGYNPSFGAPDINIKDPQGRRIMFDLVDQMDTVFRILDPPSFFSSRESVPIRAIQTQTTERDFYNRPIDTVGPGGIYSRTANLINDLFTPIGFGQSAVQIGLQQDVLPKGLVPGSEADIGTGGYAIQASGLNVRAQAGNRFDQDEDMLAYWDIPSNSQDLQAAQLDDRSIISRNEYLINNPETNAKLFMQGEIISLWTDDAANIVDRLVPELELDANQIKGLIQWQEKAEKNERLGLGQLRPSNRSQDRVSQLVDILLR
jgi:hypothetical protein